MLHGHGYSNIANPSTHIKRLILLTV